MKTIQLFLSDLKELLATQEFTSLRRALRVINPFDLADGWDHFDSEERKVLFKLLPRQRAIQLFEELKPSQQGELLKSLQNDELEKLVEDLDPSETGRMMRELPGSIVEQLEEILEHGDQGEKVERYLKYPDETVGALMRSNYVSLGPDWTCRKSLEFIHAGTLLRQIETTFLDTLFVIDPERMLKGTVTLKKLVVAPGETKIRELMNTDPEILSPEADQEEAARHFAHYRLECAPVVDRGHKLLGVVIDSDVDDVAEEEVEEDIAKMAGTAKEEFDAQTAWTSVRSRAPWLTVTVIGQLIVALIIRFYEGEISQMVALATFIPLIAALGGNVGAQSAIIMVHQLSSGEIGEGQGWKIVWRDMRVGVILGFAACVMMVFASHAFYGHRFGWSFSLVTGLGTFTAMAVAATLGALIPLTFRRVGVDPATATGPLVTTLTDIIGIASYLLLASWLLFS